MTTFRAVSVLALLALCARTAAAAELVVIASTAPAIEVGAVVEGRKRLALPAGTKLTLIAADGAVVELEGPYEGEPGPRKTGAETPGLVQSLSKLLSPRSGSGILAAFRSVPGRDPDPWSPNVARSGTYCVPADRPVRLWRKPAGGEQSVTLELIETGKKATRSWPAGSPLLEWPKELPLVDGASYFVRLDRAIGSTELILLLIPALPSDAHRAAWMGENGCERQARKVLEQLAGGS